MARRSAPLFETTSSTVFDEGDDWDGLAQRLGDVRLDRREFITAAVIGSRVDIPRLFASRQAPHGMRLVRDRQEISVFDYERRFGKKHRRGVKGRFAVIRPGHDSVFAVMTVGSSGFWRHGLLPLIDHLYPNAALPFLTQVELHRLLRDIQAAVGPERGIRVYEVSSKKRLAGSARKRFQTMREWTDADLHSVFDDARDRNVWFKSVSFDLVKDRSGHTVSEGVRGVLSKYGYFSCTGEYAAFESAILKPLIGICASRLKFFSDRARETTPGHAPRPVRISYDSDVVGTPDRTRKLVEALSRYKHATCTVLHGNPYLHLSLVDNLDFSACDIWVVEQNQIVITPQLRASAAALKRVVNHIFEHFREGKLSEHHETQS